MRLVWAISTSEVVVGAGGGFREEDVGEAGSREPGEAGQALKVVAVEEEEEEEVEEGGTGSKTRVN